MMPALAVHENAVYVVPDESQGPWSKVLAGEAVDPWVAIDTALRKIFVVWEL